ncbi:MAG: FeoB-associated Cys-rich membrane protein [Pseudobutyrivibrio sp.]|nr:FeoB-associated Cys-rich membrane protein [Pseudobutyrivibrio sp.]
MGTAIVVIVLVLIVSAAIRSIIKARKNGQHPACGGDCNHCGGGCH